MSLIYCVFTYLFCLSCEIQKMVVHYEKYHESFIKLKLKINRWVKSCLLIDDVPKSNYVLLMFSLELGWLRAICSDICLLSSILFALSMSNSRLHVKLVSGKQQLDY